MATAVLAVTYQHVIHKQERRRAYSARSVAAAVAKWIAWQERARAQFERAWQKRLKDCFLRLRRRVGRALPGLLPPEGKVIKAEPADSLERLVLEWAESDLLKVTTGLYLDAFRAVGSGINQTLGVYMPLGVGGDPGAERWASLYAGQRVKDIADSTRNALRSHIEEGLRLGLPMQNIAYGLPAGPVRPWRPDGKARPGLVSIVEETYRRRAMTIARTETAMAFNSASCLRFGAAGVNKVTVLDDHGPGSCEVCAQAHGQTWSLEEASQRPIEHPNCRRAFAPIIPALDAEAEVPPPEPPLEESLWTRRQWLQPGKAPEDVFSRRGVPEDTRKLGERMLREAAPRMRPGEEWSDLMQQLSKLTPGKYGKVKDRLVTRIAERTGLSYDQVNVMVSTWAMTSGDENFMSVLIQNVAAEMLGVAPGRYDEAKALSLWFPGIWGYNSLEEAKGAVRTYLRGIYEITQEELEAAGIETVRLYRGLTLARSSLPENVTRGDSFVHISNPLSSWSLSEDTAELFTAHYSTPRDIRVVLSMEIPRERILSISTTGMGCLREQEVVLIGGLPDTVVSFAIYPTG